MSSKETVSGLIKKIQMREERDCLSPSEQNIRVLHLIATLPLHFPFDLVRGRWRNPPPVKMKQVWTLLLKPDDNTTHGRPLLSVEMTVRSLQGALYENDHVTVTGRYDGKRGVFIPKRIESHGTGRVICPKRF